MVPYQTPDRPTTVVEDNTGTPAAFVAVIGVLVVGLLIWLFAFSGMIFDRNSDSNPPSGPNIEQNFEQQNPPAQNPPAQNPPAQEAPQDQPTG